MGRNPHETDLSGPPLPAPGPLADRPAPTRRAPGFGRMPLATRTTQPQRFAGDD
ncbi:hypothetical protein [Schaalia sp. lx-100]|uniref:hypothetical protein n=1 Tax=Schaalia sp. lx-100 TaxID=2899081 RepID=UPI001E28C461|nr:hypothetical protein [Schaalia sp. lx-100]MCD4556970.1 hypothetical protein [Schaalia sp. lx-100]